MVTWFLLCRAPHHRITRESFDRLRLGMSLPEVEAVLGGSAGDYGPGEGEFLGYNGKVNLRGMFIRLDSRSKHWLADDLAISICIDEEGHVTGMTMDDVYRPYRSTWEKICQSLKLRQRPPYPVGSYAVKPFKPTLLQFE